MKIICVGWNYARHSAELQQPLPSKPTIFLKPDTALLRENKPFYLPRFSNRIEYEMELVFRICKLGKNISERFASRYYDQVTVGVDLTARDLQSEQRGEGGPWEISKGFDGSAVIGSFLQMSELADTKKIPFSLYKNGEVVQSGNSSEMIFHIDQIVAYVSQFYTLKIGDLIYTGTPEGVGPLAIGDHLEGYLDSSKCFDFLIK